MKHNKICFLLALSIILVLLPLSAVPTHAASGVIGLSVGWGKIGDWIEVNGRSFDAYKVVRIYFSSDSADKGDDIDREVTAYKLVVTAPTTADGSFVQAYPFAVPDALTDGSYKEDVHGGKYYLYATYSGSKEIIAVATFIVSIAGEIELSSEEGTVGSEVEISGKELRPNQKITAEYEGEEVDIISGDTETGSNGQFICTIIIPESIAGSHTITVTDESGNNPGAEFTVKPKITLDPAEQVGGGEVKVSGTGFSAKELITITLDGDKISTIPMLVYTNSRGSFNADFLLLSYGSRFTGRVEARDIYFNWAEAQVTILAGSWLDPVTSPDSPGYVGMELTVRGDGFIVDTIVTITYSTNGEVIPVATARTNANGNFSASFTVLPSVAGSHVITATDGTSTVTSTFIMESQAPTVPVPLEPKVADTVAAEAYFDWGEVTDPSGVSYTLQVASDADFTTIVLEREGLPHSEYTVTTEEKLESTGKKAYYWRVKAVDGAFNEGGWSPSGLFYVGFSPTLMPGWVWYIFYGLGVLLLVILGFWVRRKFTQ